MHFNPAAGNPKGLPISKEFKKIDSWPFYGHGKSRKGLFSVASFEIKTDDSKAQLLCLAYAAGDDSGCFVGEGAVQQWIERFVVNYPEPWIHFSHQGGADWGQVILALADMERKKNISKLSVSLLSERSVLQVTFIHKKNRYTMRNSRALYPSSLASFSGIFLPEQKRRVVVGFGSSVAFDPSNPEHIESVVSDAVILMDCMSAFQSVLYEAFGVAAMATIVGTAINAWQKTTDPSYRYYYTSRHIDNHRGRPTPEVVLRGACHGGLVFLSDSAPDESTLTFHINSIYPAIMETCPMPFGTPMGTLTYHEGRMGVYDIDIEAPADLRIPILPARDEKGNTVWRGGKIRTIVTNYELDFAVQHGYRLLEVHHGLVFDQTESPFEEFVAKCKEIIRDHQGQPQAELARLLQNLLYPGFGFMREKTELIWKEDDVAGQKDLALHFGFSNLSVFRQRVYDPNVPCYLPWAVFITALARLHLLSIAYEVGVENCTRLDTDSIMVKASADLSKIPQGDEYGQCKQQ